MKTLHLMVGLPRSGKSTVALTVIGQPIVSPDAIRLALHGTAWREEAEPMVWGIARTMVEALFLAGHNEVIVDACHVTAERRRQWESPKWAISYHIIPTLKETCVERALAVDRPDLVPVIERMAAAWDPPGMGQDC
jgi:predicted kinase